MENKIDFVVTWVDGNDEAWKKQKERYSVGSDMTQSGENRYRNWDLMKYWFRGVEKFAPWVNCIYFVTCGHLPKWLNVQHPKLKIIKHEDFMPESALPTFNSNAIEIGIHRIPGLSDQFVFFNDDTFIIDEMKPSRYFHDHLPCDYAAFDAMTPSEDFCHVIINSIILVNQNFDKKKCMKDHWKKWFSIKDPRSTIRTIKLSSPWDKFVAFRNYHIPIAYLKSDFEEIWERFPEKMRDTQHHRFRCNEDYSHWLMRYWRLAKGTFHPESQRYAISKSLSSEKKIREAIDMIERQKYKVICLNDKYEGDDFDEIKARFQMAFEKILPQPSQFEREEENS